MADTALEGSSVFQLNVLIWATFAQPAEAPVTPVLRRVGYQLFSIEQPLEAGISERARLETRNPPVSVAPVADAMLEDSNAWSVLMQQVRLHRIKIDQLRQVLE